LGFLKTIVDFALERPDLSAEFMEYLQQVVKENSKAKK
jgi:UTP-glucose-1-phosphate uridylyltransferase